MNPTVRVYPQKSLDSRQIGRAFIGISLKPRKQQNVPQLGKVLDWTKEHIGQFDLLVGDFLNRHNYEAFDGMEEPAAAEVAMQHGRETVEQLHHLLALHSTTDADVLSAHALYSDPTFTSRASSFLSQYHDNPSFHALIDEAVTHFIERVQRHGHADSFVRAHCVAYQVEELALFELLAQKGYRALVYAGPQLPVMKAIVSKGLSDVSPLLEQLTLVELKFARII